MTDTTIRVSFHVLSADSQTGKFYFEGSFKTFGGARRFIHRRFTYAFCMMRKVDSWAIERHVTIGIRLHERSCVLAQSKSFPEWHNMKRENMQRFNLPFSLGKSRIRVEGN